MRLFLTPASFVPRHQDCKPSSGPGRLAAHGQPSILAAGCLAAPAIRRGHAGPAYRPLSMFLRLGFAGPCGLPHAGELLPRLSTLTAKAAQDSRTQKGKPPQALRRYLSVALSLRSPSAAVSRYPALWSSDFPQAVSRPRLPVLLAWNLFILPASTQKVKPGRGIATGLCEKRITELRPAP